MKVPSSKKLDEYTLQENGKFSFTNWHDKYSKYHDFTVPVYGTIIDKSNILS